MATTVTENILEPGNVIDESGGVVRSLTRTFRVDGLNDPTLFSTRESTALPAERIGTDRILITATEVADVPRLGEVHPDLPLLRVVRRRVRPTAGLTIGEGQTTPSHDSCFIDVDYERLPMGNSDVTKEDVQISYVLGWEETSSTFKRNAIRLKGPMTEDGTSFSPVQQAIVPVMRPQLTASFKCMTLVDEDLPPAQAAAGTGVTNSIARYTGDRLGRYNETNFMTFERADTYAVGRVGSWLCTGLESEFVGYSMDGATLTNIKQYMTTFRFEHKEVNNEHAGWKWTDIYAEDPANPGQRMDVITGISANSHNPDVLGNPTSGFTVDEDLGHYARAELYGGFNFAQEFPSIENL